MKKLKLLFASLALLVGSGTAWAQTDVTSTYITNADFESGSTFAQKKANAVSTSITGWTVSEGGNYQYYTVGASGSNTPDNDSGFGKTVTAASGSQYVHIRHGWKGSSTEIKQTLSSLPKGKYTLSVKHKGATPRSTSPTLKLSATPSGSSAIEASYNSYPTALTRDNTAWTWDNDYKDWSVLSCEFELSEAKNTEIKIRFTDSNILNTSNDEVIYDDVRLMYKNVNGSQLAILITQATTINAKIGTLTSEIATAQGVYDGINDTPGYQETIDNAISTLQTAINEKVAAYSLNPAGDDISALYIWNNGFDFDINFSSSSSTATAANTVYTTFGWTPTVPGNCTGATIGYGFSGTINGDGNVTAPTKNADGTTAGGALVICVGWSGKVTYKSLAKTFPAGSYRVTYRAYNGNTKNTEAVEAIPLVGFVPTSGDAQINSTTETFANQAWSTHTYDFELTSDTEGQIQIGLQPTSNTNSYNAPELFIDEVKLTYFNPLTLAQIQWQEVWDALDALDETALPDAAETAITDALSAVEPTTVEGYNSSKETMQTLIDSYDGIKAAYEKALALIDLATDEKDNSTGTKTTFATAISTATTDIETRTTAADLTSDYNTLETARQAYVTSGAQPTAGNVFDYTFKIPDAAVTSATDWSNKRTGSGEQYTGAPDNTYFDNYNENRNVQKNIGTLRLGKFELKVATRSEASVTVGNIYVSQNAANLNQTDIHHDGNTGGDLGNGWSWTTVAFDNYVDDKDITLGFYSECGSSKWAGADDFHLYYKGNAVDDETAEALKGTVVSGKMNATVASAQTTALSEFESAQTFENYNTLKSAIEAASASIAVYEILDAAIAKVEGWTATTAAAGLRTKHNNGEYADDVTADNIYTEYQAAEIAALAADPSAVDWTSVILDHSFESGGMDFWSAISRNDTGVKDQSNGTYSITSGDPVDGLKLFNSWGGTAENNVYQTIKDLPAGTYTLAAVLAGFQEESLVLAANETTNNVVVTGDKTVGYLTTVTFTLDATTDVVIKASNTKSGSKGDASFIKADNFQLYVGSSIPASAYKPTLLLAIDKATNARKSANEGSGAFQIPASAGTTLASAIATAQGVYDNASATVEQVNQATTDINTARTTYENAELNAPANGKLFNVVLTYSGYAYDQKAMTYIANGRSDAGNYNIQYKEAANKNLAQAFTFTKVSGNNYKMSQIDADYAIRYISTGVPYGGNASQIRTTTEADDALIVTVIPTATEGVWNLKNTEANNYIGSQDAGVYTVNSHIDFNIVETTQAAITINTKAAGWGTLMLPFDMSIPTGGKAYTCGAAEGNTLTLVEVEGDLQPNTPYIIEGAWDCIVSGDAQGTDLTYTNGLLTGVYKDTQVPADKFVLQKKSTTVGFYKVAEGKEPTAKANRAYLTAPTAGARFDAFFFGNETTGINAINALLSGKAEIYNLKGEKIDRLQKGMNIIKTNGKIQKVMVK